MVTLTYERNQEIKKSVVLFYLSFFLSSYYAEAPKYKRRYLG